MRETANVRYTYMSKSSVAKIRKESASQAIYKTIKMLETELGIKFARGSALSESREIMVETIESYFR